MATLAEGFLLAMRDLLGLSNDMSLMRRGGIGGGAIVFGALTKAAAGGVLVPAGATSIAGGDASGHWQIVSGRICPSAAGDAANLNLGPYNLTFQNVTTMTINVQAGRFDARTSTEYLAVLNGAEVAFGNHVVLRDGEYNQARAGDELGRSAAPIGTWNGSNYIVVRSENALAARIWRLLIRGTTFANAYVHFSGVTFDVSGRGGGALINVLNSVAAPAFVRISGCLFTGGVNPSRINSDDLHDCIALNTGGSNIILDGNTFYDCGRPMYVAGADCIVRNNFVRRFWGDGIQFNGPCPRLQVIGNDFSDVMASRVEYTITAVTRGASTQVTVTDATGITTLGGALIFGTTGLEAAIGVLVLPTSIVGNVVTLPIDTSGATPWVSGGQLWFSASHPDHVQGVLGGATTDGDLDDMVFRGNRFTSGAAVIYLSDAQGIFMGGQPATTFMRRLIIEGNIIETRMVNGIYFIYARDAEIRYNTVVRKLGHPLATGTQTISAVSNSTGVQVYGNVCNAFALSGVALNVNNVVVAYNSTAYSNAFVSPPTGLGPTVGAVDYAPKPGGNLAGLSVVPGALPHQSYVNPWTFTNPTPALIPSNTVAPVASGTPTTGNALTATNGTWAGFPPPTFTYQWQTSPNGVSGWIDLGGATSSSYTLVSGDINNYIRCRVRGTNASGNGDGFSNVSAQITAGVYVQKRYDTNGTARLSYTPTGTATCVEHSMWIKPFAFVPADRIIRAPQGYEIQISGGSGAFNIIISDSVGTTVYNATSATGVLSTSAYTHIYIAAKLSSTSSIEIRANGSLLTMATVTTNLLTGPVAGTGFSRKNRVADVFNSNGLNIIDCEFGDFWLQYENSLLGYASFHSSGSPTSLVGVGSPVLLLGGTQTAANINSGGNLGSALIAVGSATFTDV